MRSKRSFLLAGILFFSAFCIWPDDGPRGKIIEAAQKYLGVPYVYGAESPSAFDCSGFVRYIYRTAAAINIPRTSKTIWASGQTVRIAAARPGDILVFDTLGGGTASHVAILMDDENMIHAVSSGPHTGVIISPVRDRYFSPRLMGIRSFIAAGPLPVDNGGKAPVPVQEQAVEPLGLVITNDPVIYSDRIPAALGSAIQFHITNGTGRDGSFVVLFYKMDLDPAKHKTVQQLRVSVAAGARVETPPVFFTEPGQYRLILKTRDNMKRIERNWNVVKL